ncbi:hypothetical protein ACFVJH_31535 [Streptomyces decoyicus]|uniref:hypothetical protein n=1 Tax=Streptomyces decoyicus TaxID=249567 RepID=UPI00363BE6C6
MIRRCRGRSGEQARGARQGGASANAPYPHYCDCSYTLRGHGVWRRVYRDAPLVTQFTELSGGGLVPYSSASMPSTVVRRLRDLDVQPGHRVLEIGTGTGFHAAPLSLLFGAENVGDEVAHAHEEYVSAGRPGIAKHRLHISPDVRSTRHEVSLA